MLRIVFARFALASLSVCLISACNKPESSQAQERTKRGSEAGSAQSAPAAQGGGRNRVQPVITTVSESSDVPIVLSAQGNVIPLDEVDVRAQVTGTVAAIHFQEGDNVKRSQVLLTLDNRENTAAVRRAEAAVAGANAQLDIAQRDFARTEDLSSKNFVSSAALDAARNKVDAARAALLQTQAALEEARVALSYATIRAPFDGRAGRLDVRPGSLLTNTTSIVKITRMTPIGISFTVPEGELPGLLAAQRRGPIRVEVATDNGRALIGEVSFIENTVDRAAGTIAIKARVNNEARSLWPGQFVTVQITAGSMEDVVVLPAQAVVNGPSGRFVYRVNDDQTVSQQPVEVLRVVEQRAVLKGIQPGVKVVLEGAQNLRPGSKVEEVTAAGAGGERSGRRRGGAAGDQSRPAGIGADSSAPRRGPQQGGRAS